MLSNPLYEKKRYVKPADPSLYDLMERLSRIDSMVDPLVNLNAVIS